MATRVSVSFHEKGHPFGGDFTDRIRRFEMAAKTAADQAAATANRGTRSRVKNLRPPAPDRPGRQSTQGNMGRHLNWKVTDAFEVQFDVQHANKRVPYWIIQEVGTGKSATMLYGGSARRRGRQHGSAVKVIPSQIGRPIPGYLAFGTGPRGQYSAFGQRRNENLYLRRNLKGAPVFRGKGAASNDRGPSGPRSMVTIGREIEGKHMVRDGAKEGFRQYRRSLLAAARSTLVKKWTP